jgi:glycerate-2-kinase
MTELLLTKEAAEGFVAFNINQEAMSIVLTRNANGTYSGVRTFNADGPVPDQASAAAAKTAANAAIEAKAAKVEVTLKSDGKYVVA